MSRHWNLDLQRAIRLATRFWHSDRSLSVLLALLVVLLFVVTPLAHSNRAGALLNGLVFTLLAITGTVAVSRRTAVVLTVAVIGGARLLLDFLGHTPLSHGLLLGDLLLRASLVFIIAIFVTRQIFRRGNVSHHRVQGAIVIYLLAALAWAYVYEIIDLLDPGAFHVANSAGFAPNLSLFRFFSFETLTTLGYGDIVPVSAVARALAAGEALFGQLYPAVMITRLVSLEFAARSRRLRE